MPRNVEVKARVADLAAARSVAERLGARHEWTDVQVDRYYRLDGSGRLKLRTCGRAPAELIRYERPEETAVRTSAYEITATRDDAQAVCLVPQDAPLAVVRKRRELWLLDNVRIHLDTVDGLGTFLELEAVVDASHDEAACGRRVATLLDALGIAADDCVRASYGDLLRA